MYRAGRVLTFEVVCVTGKRDGPLHERSKLFGLRQSSDDSFVAGVNQRSCQVTQHRHAMLRGAAQFSMCLQVSHYAYSSSSGYSLVSPSRPPVPGIGLPCASNSMPKSNPMPLRMSLISFNDFLPKFLVASISRSERCTRSRMVLIPAFFRQLYERTESSSSSTERSN